MGHEPDGPADTTMMGIVHSAMRRDLTRARLVLTAEGTIPPTRRTAIAEHLSWLVDFLRDHHEGEDTGLYPMVRAKDPSLGPILDAMDAEHEAIHPAMDALSEAAARWKENPAEAPAVLAAIQGLESVLNPHLQHEEDEMMPLVQRTITQREWHEWDQAANVKSKGTRDLAYTGHWLVDGVTAEDFAVVTHEVPAVPRFVLLHLLGGPYKRRRAAMWANTPADAGSTG
jgi:hemerythrin-like domain-containing protein